MVSGNRDPASELQISLEQLLIIQDKEATDDYGDNHVGRMSCLIVQVGGESETEVKNREVELIYFDGCHTVDTALDILDVADSAGEEEYRYAKAVCAGGVLDELLSSDLPAVSVVSILPEYPGREHGTLIVRRLVEVASENVALASVNSPWQFTR